MYNNTVLFRHSIDQSLQYYYMGRDETLSPNHKFFMTSTGFAVVRVKPWRRAGGGSSGLREGATSAVKAFSNGTVRVETDKGRVRISNIRTMLYLPLMDKKTHIKVLSPRINAFLNGVNVNVMCYGQTGSGKTHTMFGLPNLMRRAGSGIWGMEVMADYGIVPGHHRNY